MIINRIERLTLQLDYNWYLNLKSSFINEGSFRSDTNTLHDNSTEEGEETDFKSYCWYSIPPGCYEHDEDYVRGVDASGISQEIIDEVKRHVEKISEVAAAHKIISAAIQAIGNCIEQLIGKSVKEDAEYAVVLDHFLMQTRKGISKNHGHIKEAYNISTEHTERLSFELNQEELAALLYILYDAGIIHTPTPTDTTFLNFCMEYFYFKNQKTKTHTPPTKLRSKFNEIKNGESHVAKEKVVAKLKSVLSR